MKLLLPFTKLLNDDYNEEIKNKDYLSANNLIKSNNVNSMICSEINIKGIIVEFYNHALN